MKAWASLVAALLLAVPFSAAAKADTAGIDFLSPGSPMNNGLGFSLGYAFTANTSITVTALGYFDDGGLKETHTVGLYNSNGGLLAWTTVNGTGLQQGFFNYNAVGPVTLTAGDGYEVMGTSGLLDGYTFGTAGFTVAPEITYQRDVFASDDVLQFSTRSENLEADAGGAFFGANFLTSSAVTPEPGSLLLMGTGLTCVAGLRRRSVRV